MLGDRGDRDIFGNPNELVHFKSSEPQKVWAGLLERLLAIPAYVDLFHAAYPGTPTEALGFQHVANAIGAYEAAAFSYLDSPWDAYLRGDADALSDSAKRGAVLFYGAAGCAECHSGVHFTDFQFHNMAVPHVGPGKGREEPLDFGRARETGDSCDLFAYRTPPLRNVTLTGPWMHDGAYTTLEGAVRHMLDPVGSLRSYDPSQLAPELQTMVYLTPEIIARQLEAPSAPDPGARALTDEQIADLLAFLEALTDPAALDWQPLVPDSVPSGLTVGGE
jgi:cytochrome c peroxidase